MSPQFVKVFEKWKDRLKTGDARHSIVVEERRHCLRLVPASKSRSGGYIDGYCRGIDSPEPIQSAGMGCAAVGAGFCICACGRRKSAWLFARLKKAAATRFGADMPGSAGGLCRHGDLDETPGGDGSCSPTGSSCTRGAGCAVAEKESCGVWVRLDPTLDAMRLCHEWGTQFFWPTD